MTALETFFLLQVLDFMTTLVGLRMGGTELSPFVAWVMEFGEVLGLTVAKGIGFALGGYCVWARKMEVIHWVNYFFAGLVIWNLWNILKAVSA